MERTIDWAEKARKARGMTDGELLFAVRDCHECVKLDINAGYYSDEASVYVTELRRRRGGK